jgi:hypothetical protein
VMSGQCGLPNSRLYDHGAYSGATKQRMFALMLLPDLPAKTSHRLLKSVTWIEMDAAVPAHTRFANWLVESGAKASAS